MARLVLDTDIGTDVDDALALALLLGSPEIDLIGVTTVYGDTLVRAKLARRLVRLANPEVSIPFVPGSARPLSSRDVWWPGHEGTLFDDLADEPVETGCDAVSYLIDTVAAHPGDIEVLCIGPLTNIAQCLRQDSQFACNVRRLTLMGGDFSPHGRTAEYNFAADAVAAKEVLESDLRLTIVGFDVTTQIRLTPLETDQIGKAGPLGAALRAEIERFWGFAGHPWNNPHDPIAAMTLLRPDLFGHEERSVRIAAEGSQPGLAIEDGSARRSARIITSLDKAAVRHEIVRRIVAGCHSGSGAVSTCLE